MSRQIQFKVTFKHTKFENDPPPVKPGQLYSVTLEVPDGQVQEFRGTSQSGRPWVGYGLRSDPALLNRWCKRAVDEWVTKVHYRGPTAFVDVRPNFNIHDPSILFEVSP